MTKPKPKARKKGRGIVGFALYATLCKSGALHGRDGQNPMRWLSFRADWARADRDMLAGWDHKTCGPHRVVKLTEVVP